MMSPLSLVSYLSCFLYLTSSHFLPTCHAWIPSVSCQLPAARFSTTRRYVVSKPNDQSVAPDTRYYSYLDAPMSTRQTSKAPPVTLARYLTTVVKKHPELSDLEFLYLAIQMACKTTSNLVGRAGLVWDNTAPRSSTTNNQTTSFPDGRFYSMKRLDQLSTIVLRNALQYTGKCKVVEPSVELTDSESPAQHQPGVLIAKSLMDNGNQNAYVACLDPLDGSGNADASICTGTVFGVFQ